MNTTIPVLTVANPIDMTWSHVSCTVLSSSKYGLPYDRVKVLHEIGLASPLTQDESFYAPAVGRPIDVRTVYPDGNIVTFVGQRFADLQDELSKYGQAVASGNLDELNRLHELFKSVAMLTPVLFKQGTQVLTFEYELALHPMAEDSTDFELTLLAPMPSFRPVGQSQITVLITLPSPNNVGFGATVIEKNGYAFDPATGQVTGEVPLQLEQDYGLRKVLVWNWQQDPYFRVHYRYN
ncbi:hypothetical protein K0T92_16315 [Paenibacillus oenotherae]|uniref:Uncharacterized protein n=1 Tax=Paenibacillus oenotherae TaxID=1435645 RepID=A0ABS7D8N8_9BACL|nr:hypothetical protein [Paenibacillus oenotherae]MBW7476298.1 hypothetical protein [Paenibacillus oenotherae]